MTGQVVSTETGIETKYREDARGNFGYDGFGRGFNSPRLHQNHLLTGGWEMNDQCLAI